jgi:hypothetical protein
MPRLYSRRVRAGTERVNRAAMSAFGGKADIDLTPRNVRF